MKNKLWRALAIASLFSVLFTTYFYDASVYAAQTATAKPAPRHKTELLVKYKTGTNGDNVRSRVQTKLKLGKLETKSQLKADGVAVLRIGDGDNLDKTIAALRQDPDIEYAQPNYVLHAAEAPEDARYDEQWGLANAGQSIGFQSGVLGVDIRASAAWSVTSGSPAVLVGVLDTGIDIAHPDLANSIYLNPGEVAGNGIDDDGNGYIDDVNGYDFANGDGTVFDSASSDAHGTHVAGIVAAQADSVGIRGVAPGVKLLPLKFLSGGSGYTSDAIEAIGYAKAMGATIINASFGGPDNNPALREAMADSGLLFVASAGNHGGSVDENPIYPASFDLPTVLSVTAIDNRGELAAFSGFGSTVDLAAPGMGILSTEPGDGYAFQSGTSMAAPFVAGAAALLLSRYPDLTATDLAARLTGNVTTAAALDGKVVAGGWLNAAAALAGEGGGSVPAPEPQPGGEEAAEAADSTVVAMAAAVSPELQEQIHYGEEGVNVATGNYGKKVTDLSVQAPGFQVNISRAYNSKDDRATSSMGRGWTFGFEGSVKDDTTNPSQLKVVRLPDGEAQVFVKESNGTYTANDSHSTLVKQADNSHILTTSDQYSYGFNTSGFLVWMQDRDGNRLTIEMDSAGRTRKITDTVGRVYTFGYNGAGYVTSVTDPIGRSLKYEYNAQNLLVKVTDVDGQIKDQYAYDSSNYLNTVKNGTGETLETLVYDHVAGTNQHKVTQSTNSFGNRLTYTYDTTNRKTTIVDLSGRTLVKWYDTAGYIVKSQDPEGKETLVEYYLDSSNYNKYGEEKHITDRYGNKTTYERYQNGDPSGNITKKINPDLSFREYGYDTRNNLIYEIDELGKLTQYIYDAKQVKLLKKVQPLNGTDIYTNDSDADLFAITSYSYYSDAESTRLGYKAKGLLRAETGPEGGTISYTYDEWGNEVGIRNAEGSETVFEYNKIGWLMEKLSPLGYVTVYTYDKAGRVVRTIADGGETTFTEYDALGRVVQSVSPGEYDVAFDGLFETIPVALYRNETAGSRITYLAISGLAASEINALGYKTAYQYDIYGNKVREEKPNGSIYLYRYDNMNRLIEVSFQTSDTQPVVKLEQYAYSSLSDGRQQQTKTVYFSETDKAASVTTYDQNGREVELQRADGTSTTTSYEANGLVKAVTDARGNSTYYRYDGLNRLIGSWLPTTEGQYRYEGTVYDRSGHVIREHIGKDPVALYRVPAEDRLIRNSAVYTAGGLVTEKSDSAGGKVNYEYDEEGRIVREDLYATDNEAIVTKYVYDHRNQKIQKRQEVRSGDLAGNDFDNDEPTTLVTSYMYDAEGRLLTETAPDGVVKSFVYDRLGRVIKTITEGRSEQGIPVEIGTYSTYDWAGNVLTSTDPNLNTTTFEYDARGNLLRQIDAKDGVTAYTYDRAGRKVLQVSPNAYNSNLALDAVSHTAYTYDKMSRVQLVTETFTEKKVNPITFAWVDMPVSRVTMSPLT